MQQYFLPLVSELKLNQTVSTKGLWLVHSDEPLMEQWLIDALKPHWLANELTLKRLELTSVKSWQDVINELCSLGLFEQGTALIVTGKHKPDQKILKALTSFAQDVKNEQSYHHLLWCLPKQDKKSLASKAMKLFDSDGMVIDANIYNEQIRANVLTAKADELQLNLSADAWQLLLSHTEHNLLTAFQTLWRLSYLPPIESIDIRQLTNALVEGSQFDVFSLSDSLLAGDIHKSLHILYHLKHTEVAPSLVLWVMSKDARFITQIQANKDPHSLGIWQNKVYAYQQAALRTQHLSRHWSEQIYCIDKAIKGLGQQDVWQQIQQFAISLCGIDQKYINYQ